LDELGLHFSGPIIAAPARNVNKIPSISLPIFQARMSANVQPFLLRLEQLNGYNRIRNSLVLTGQSLTSAPLKSYK
jgi:hypothetical protein